MTEPITTIGLGAIAAYLGKDGLEKLLGPTADYLGTGLKDFTQKRAEAVGRIFSSAQKKVGDKVGSPGEVPPKVLKTVLNEGSYSTDQLAVEYFGGILASARTEDGRDDRSARLAKAVDSLSTYQLRAHYLIYTSVRRLFADAGLSFNMNGRPKMRFFIPMLDFVVAMDLSQKEQGQLGQLLNHVFFGLHGDSLIETGWQYGPKDHMLTVTPKATSDGIVCQPSALGAELFLAAFGKADQELEYIFSPELKVSLEGVSNGFISAVATEA